MCHGRSEGFVWRLSGSYLYLARTVSFQGYVVSFSFRRLIAPHGHHVVWFVPKKYRKQNITGFQSFGLSGLTGFTSDVP